VSEIDKLKDAIKNRLGVDLDREDTEREAKRRQAEAEAAGREAERNARLEEVRLNVETAEDLIKKGTLIVSVNGARRTNTELFCACGEPLTEAREALADFGEIWRHTPDKERVLTCEMSG